MLISLVVFDIETRFQILQKINSIFEKKVTVELILKHIDDTQYYAGGTCNTT